jgi:hypothetical protein
VSADPSGTWPKTRGHRLGRSAVKDRPADVVPQTLVVKDQVANPLRELVTLPVALESPGGLTFAFWRGSTRGLDRVGGGTELVRGDMCDGPGLASGVRGMSRCPTQVPGRAHGMAARCASLHHRDLTVHPGAGVLDRITWSWVIGLSRLEQVKDVLRARRSPQSEEMVIRVSEGPTATNRHKPRVPNLGEDHWLSARFLVSAARSPGVVTLGPTRASVG